MKACYWAATMVVLFLCGCVLLFNNIGDTPERFIVTFDWVDDIKAVALSANKLDKIKVIDILDIINGIVIEMPANRAGLICANFTIRYIEKDVEVFALPIHSNNLSSKMPAYQQGNTSILEDSHWNMAMIRADEVWNVNQGAGVRVGVLDTGILSQHPDFMSNGKSSVVKGYNAIDGGSTEDDNGHGTCCAAIIGARRNDVGIIGVARDCTLVPIKVLDRNGSGYSSNVVKGYQWALFHGDVDVMNVSLGSNSPSQAMADAMDVASRQGMGTVCASGNDGQDRVIYPARNSYAVCVGAVGTDGKRASFSNYGPKMLADGVVAPGEWVYTAWLDNGWRRVSGTSAAAPHVTGLFAVLKAMGMGWRGFVYRSASNTMPTMEEGYGLVDVKGAVELLIEYSERGDR